MAKRSLKASAEGIRKAKQAFKRKRLTQKRLAGEVGLDTRQPIWKFFTGQPVDRQVFHEICRVLGINSKEIIENTNSEKESISIENILENSLDIDYLVQKARFAHQEKIQAQCGTLHLLDISRPIGLDDLYVEVNIFEEITNQRWLEINNLQSLCSNNFNSFNCGQRHQHRVTGLEAVSKYSKLLILGKPGSGKTTFLQSIALRCAQRHFQHDSLPIFINLKNFAEDSSNSHQSSLLAYINQEFSDCGVSQTEISTILSHGKALILLDGLDEFTHIDNDKIFREIRNFIEKYYKNKIIITCRLAAFQYKFKGFTEVEIADFTLLQIRAFVDKWFVTVAKNSLREGRAKADNFIQKLELPENRQILELATVPVLLNLTCLVFQFLGDFPTLRSELYKQALELLLVRWDEARGVKRDEVYRNLSLSHKIKLLCYLASTTFSQGNYFFSENNIQQLIASYLRHFPLEPIDVEALQIDSGAVLKAIEAQHGLLLEQARGIYSFSHLTFQEYLTAREIVANANSQTLLEFVTQIGDKRWQEVFLLTAGMIQPADELLLLMKQQINILANSNLKLHNFLIWLEHKSSTISASYHPASIRAFYFTLNLPIDHPLANNQTLAVFLDHRLTGKLADDLALDLALVHALGVSLKMSDNIFCQRLSAIKLAVDLQDLLHEYPSLEKSLQQLQSELPYSYVGKIALKEWWQANGETWTLKLQNLIVSDRQICQDWQFNEKEWQLLQQYWDANKLLLDCLNHASNVTNSTIQLIEKTLFLVESVVLASSIAGDR
ncbi:NACHT domain-containing NTPase [Chlorogloeopsis sp. ULAP01]|uniref:NACHT domain-containing protein n=1 Tax=Chlorogloeopsis sp. ULAP01 TaxID=3056483 RepID=UPI0025AA699D|nr:NACHT domain-containing NTPase [Chlorogloeopsis sp. ULAP01]MDM9382790.1 NACHT domain-containing NTPase [Chlorogloeopsis sp. ULAP01]